MGASETTPENDERLVEAASDHGQHRRMPERIGTIQNARRLGPQRTQGTSPRKQIPHQRFAARNQLVGEHEPGPRLELSVSERRGELRGALRPNLQVVLEDYSLSVEEKAVL